MQTRTVSWWEWVNDAGEGYGRFFNTREAAEEYKNRSDDYQSVWNYPILIHVTGTLTAEEVW